MLSGLIQSDIEVPQSFVANISNFLPVFKITLVSKNDIGDLTKIFAEKKE